MDPEISDKADHNSPKGSLFEKNLRRITNYSYAAILGLIVSLILLALEQRLAAGIVIITCSAAGIFLLRNWLLLIRKAGDAALEAADSNVQKEQMITGFSHKIREPLNNLVLISDMLIDSGLDRKQKDLVETFAASTNNMVSTVNELTMQSAGNLNFEARKNLKFRIFQTIQNTLELYGLKENSLLRFSLNNQEFNDFECYGDPIVLKQIFLAVFNVIEDTRTDVVTNVTISLSNELKTDALSVVAIKLITDRPINLINEVRQENDLVARLIKAGKGNYTMELTEKQTVLSFSLPFTIVPEEPKVQIASSRIEELIQKSRMSKELKDLNVLIVEDNAINKKITELTLKPLVRSIDTASNGKEALDKFGSASFDLILMDIQMPVMSGLQAAEKIRALEASTNSHVPIIAITANAMLGDRERCISAGIDDYISKPFQPSTLIEKIKSCI